MALPVHSGTAAIDLNNNAAYRQDISEVILVPLVAQSNVLGLFQVGAEFAGEQLWWNEDALNQFKITGDTTASMTSAATTINISQADASVVKAGYILVPDTTLGVPAVEYMQVTAVNGTALTVSRAFAGTAASYASNTVFRIVDNPVNPNSDLGPDLTRQRLVKTNYIRRERKDVNIDSEQIARSIAGYVPGVQDELGYQLQMRLAELIRDWDNTVIYGKPQATSSPTNEFQTMTGLLSWLDATSLGNSLSSPITTSENLTDTVLNNMIQNIYKQGAVSKAVIVGPRLAQVLAAYYADTIRREQSDRVRGFWMNVFDPAMANPHVLVNDAYVQDTAGNSLCFVVDPDRIFWRPFIGQSLYTIEAPSFRDGDAISLLSKGSLEVRNSGTDAGYAHQVHQNIL